MRQIVEEYNRMVGVGPSLAESAAADPMLTTLSKAFSAKVKLADVKFLRYRKAGKGVELEDKAARLGGILTSVEPQDADPKTLMAFLKKHGAKPAPKVESLEEGYKSLDMLYDHLKTMERKGIARLDKAGGNGLPSSAKGLNRRSKGSGEVVQLWWASDADRKAGEKYLRGLYHKLMIQNDPRVSQVRVSLSESFDETLEESDNPAAIILKQMGGPGRLKAMLGAKHFISHDGGKALSFQFPNRQRSKGNYVKITLRPDDTYDMEFSKIVKYEAKPVKTYSGIHADQLKPIFERQTGLRLSLGF